MKAVGNVVAYQVCWEAVYYYVWGRGEARSDYSGWVENKRENGGRVLIILHGWKGDGGCLLSAWVERRGGSVLIILLGWKGELVVCLLFYLGGKERGESLLFYLGGKERGSADYSTWVERRGGVVCLLF